MKISSFRQIPAFHLRTLHLEVKSIFPLKHEAIKFKKINKERKLNILNYRLSSQAIQIQYEMVNNSPLTKNYSDRHKQFNEQ